MTLHFFFRQNADAPQSVFLFLHSFFSLYRFFVLSNLFHCISGQCEIYACSVFSLFCLPLDFSVKLIAHMKISAGGGPGQARQGWAALQQCLSKNKNGLVRIKEPGCAKVWRNGGDFSALSKHKCQLASSVRISWDFDLPYYIAVVE